MLQIIVIGGAITTISQEQALLQAGYILQAGYFSDAGYILHMQGMFRFFPTFEENGMFMLGMGFLFSQFSPIEIIVFDKNCLYSIEDIDFLGSNFS